MRASRVLPGILAFALAVRVGVAVSWAPPAEADAADYVRLADNLVAGRGYVDPEGRPTAWRPPGYPAFIAGLYSVFGERPEAVRLAQAVLSTGTVALTYAVASAAATPVTGLVAAAVVAVDLGQVFSVSRLLSETLFTTLLLLSVWLLVGLSRGDPRLRPGPALAAGISVGLATLTRGLMLLYPVAVVAVWPVLRGRRSGRRMRNHGRELLLAALAFVVTLAPWTIRNLRVFDAFVPVATQGGMTLYSGNFPPGPLQFGMLRDDETTRHAAELPEPEASSFLVAATGRRLLREPSRIPGLMARKALFFFVPLDWEVLPWYGSLDVTYAFVLLWCGVFLWLALRRAGGRHGAPERWPVWLPVAYMFVLALVFYGSPRFRLPLEPLLAIGAAAGLTMSAGVLGRARTAVLAMAAMVGLVALALVTGPLKDAARALMGVA